MNRRSSSSCTSGATAPMPSHSSRMASQSRSSTLPGLTQALAQQLHLVLAPQARILGRCRGSR